MLRRPRRNRKSHVIRDMIAETQVTAKDLIYPLFCLDKKAEQVEVLSMPGIFRWGLEPLLKEIESSMELGLKNFILFPCVEDSLKDKTGSLSYREDFFYLQYLSEIKKRFPECCLITDVALDPYSSDGHDGIVKEGKVLNDETLEVLCKMSVAQAQAGADVLGPSDMMDGRIGAIRTVLDESGFSETSIMSYTAKYASSFYGPFRDALDSAPKHGDKKTYQMDYRNSQEALIEAQLDVEEGADFLMVKPALAYLDIIRDFKANFEVPIAAYNVSGEYAMVKAAAEKGWIDGQETIEEILTSIKRAGADVILTYFAKEFVTR